MEYGDTAVYDMGAAGMAEYAMGTVGAESTYAMGSGSVAGGVIPRHEAEVVYDVGSKLETEAVYDIGSRQDSEAMYDTGTARRDELEEATYDIGTAHLHELEEATYDMGTAHLHELEKTTYDMGTAQRRELEEAMYDMSTAKRRELDPTFEVNGTTYAANAKRRDSFREDGYSESHLQFADVVLK